jgi:hypothetical protein
MDVQSLIIQIAGANLVFSNLEVYGLWVNGHKYTTSTYIIIFPVSHITYLFSLGNRREVSGNFRVVQN